MSAKLSSQDWAQLTHAYGSAADVPALLQALGNATDASEWDAAFDELSNLINHQGSTYEASVAAVPYLIDLLDTVDGRQRPRLLRLLRFLGIGQLYDYLGSMFRFVDETSTRIDGVDVPDDAEAVRAREAIARHAPAIARWLADEDPAVTQAAAYVLELSGTHRQLILDEVEMASVQTAAGLSRAAHIYLDLTAVTPDQRPHLAAVHLEREASPEGRVVARLALHEDSSVPWTDADATSLVADLCDSEPFAEPLGGRTTARAICEHRASTMEDQLRLCRAMLRAPCAMVQHEAVEAAAWMNAEWRHAGRDLAPDVADLLATQVEEARFEASCALVQIDTSDPQVHQALLNAFTTDESRSVRLIAGLAIDPAALHNEQWGPR